MQGRAWYDKLLQSKILKGVFRIHMGFELIGSWTPDWLFPRLTHVHLFEWLLWKRSKTRKPFKQWLKDRDYNK